MLRLPCWLGLIAVVVAEAEFTGAALGGRVTPAPDTHIKIKTKLKTNTITAPNENAYSRAL